MTEHARSNFEEQLEAYMDGRLTEEEHAAFEAHLSEHPEIASAVQRQREINASLRRQFTPPSAEELRERVLGGLNGERKPALHGAEGAEPIRATLRLRPMRRLALAASLLLAFAGVWMMWSVLGSPGEGPYAPVGPRRTMEVVFNNEVAENFTPDWVCEGPVFEQVFRHRLSAPLQIATLPSSVAALGISYANTISRHSTCVLARADGEPVLVIIDRLEFDPRTKHPGAIDHPEFDPTQLSESSDLKLHRRELGPLVLYELSRFSEPRVIEHLYIPEQGPEQ